MAFRWHFISCGLVVLDGRSVITCLCLLVQLCTCVCLARLIKALKVTREQYDSNVYLKISDSFY